MKQGFIALVSVIIIFTVSFITAISIALMGADTLKDNYRANLSTKAFYYAEACEEEGLNRLRQSWAGDSGTITFDDGSCSFTITAGATGTVVGEGVVSEVTRGIQIIVNTLCITTE